ncbi:hypothetical protein EYC84_006497 [Monilinia fructicola]|uniref:Protein kinase domain-containing protein n=1 Tax=Monilinia fructicola TaxID=38448 RepID=A0A5M9KBS9_MONFR|nr:hypothetical protein EYC84_006497 [Monilinia fructicola]
MSLTQLISFLSLQQKESCFNWIVKKGKLTEEETRKVFTQLFEGLKYLHERGIVHREISKPENILMTDENLHVKLADFGLSKIIGEASFHDDALDNPYDLKAQIKLGRFDYPSPYWDTIGDPALDLIDHMLTVDPEKRYTVDECLAASMDDPEDYQIYTIIARERTLLSAINEVKVSKIIQIESDKDPVKIYVKNPNAKSNCINQPASQQEPVQNGTKNEDAPAAQRDPNEFMEMGGKGDQTLFDNTNNGESIYPEDVDTKAKSPEIKAPASRNSKSQGDQAKHTQIQDAKEERQINGILLGDFWL